MLFPCKAVDNIAAITWQGEVKTIIYNRQPVNSGREKKDAKSPLNRVVGKNSNRAIINSAAGISQATKLTWMPINGTSFNAATNALQGIILERAVYKNISRSSALITVYLVKRKCRAMESPSPHAMQSFIASLPQKHLSCPTVL